MLWVICIAAAFNVKYDGQKPDALKFPDLTLDEIAMEIDRFYGDGSNGPVPVVLAVGYVSLKAQGDTPEDLEKYAASVRKSLANSVGPTATGAARE